MGRGSEMINASDEHSNNSYFYQGHYINMLEIFAGILCLIPTLRGKIFPILYFLKTFAHFKSNLSIPCINV